MAAPESATPSSMLAQMMNIERQADVWRHHRLALLPLAELMAGPTNMATATQENESRQVHAHTPPPIPSPASGGGAKTFVRKGESIQPIPSPVSGGGAGRGRASGREEIREDVDAIFASKTEGQFMQAHEGFVEFLRRHGLLPLWSLGGASLAHGMGAEHWMTQQEVVQLGLMVSLQERAIQRMGQAFEAAGLPWLILKSLGYRHELYPSPELRPATDIDVLIHAADRQRAERCLLDLGGKCMPAQSLSGHEITYRLDAVDIDLHWNVLAPGRMPLGFAHEILSRRRRSGPLYRPQDDDALLIALVHPAFAKHVCSPHMGLNRVMDLLLLCDRFQVDLDCVVTRLRQVGVAGAAWATLDWVRRLSPVQHPVLEELHARLEPGRLRSNYIQLWIKRDWPGRLIDRAPWLTQLALLSLLHDRPRHVLRALAGRMRRNLGLQ